MPALTSTAVRGSELAAERVEVRFDGVLALDAVDVTLHRGEILGLLGPNGSGKSTLVDVLAGARRPTSGRVLIDGIPVPPDARSLARHGVARTFQNIRLFDELTVEENIVVPLTTADAAEPRSAALRRARELLGGAGIAELADRLPRTLSYGDRRRVEIVRARALDPGFLLLDEPAAGMNRGETDALAARIREISRELGCGILLIEHDVPFVLDLADRVVVIAQGRVIADGEPASIRADPAVRTAYLGGDG